MIKTNRLPGFSEIPLILSILIYLAFAISLFPRYQYQLNPDGISYISIAQKYLAHNYTDAINGYWGPLISWLMVPFLASGLKPLVAANLLLLIIGLTVVLQSHSLIKTLNINLLLGYATISSISIIVIYFAFHTITPDLLFVSLSLAFIIKILDSSYTNDRYAGLFIGLTGSGLYFSKSFGLPFFISSFLAVSLILYFRTRNLNERRRILNNYISGMLIFLIISGFWISLISHKYGQFLIGTAGIYNRAISEPSSPGHPMFFAGLIDPPNNTAISIWEDVSRLDLKNWGVFDSFKSFIYELKIICKNLLNILTFLSDFSLLLIPVLLIASARLLKTGKQFVYDNIFFLLLIITIMFSGYALIAVDPRYIWLSYIILLITGAKLLSILFEKSLKRKSIRLVITGIFIISALAYPVKSIFHSLDNGKYLIELNNKMTSLNIKGRIASVGDWERSFYLSFHNGWQYYGRSSDHEESYLENELKNKMIDYYFVWESNENRLKFLQKYQEISGGRIEGLRIYKLK
jgi:hypothetical protein